ncbi:hypothetical protein BKA62DRAFT_775781 [Auriculariales sp. MPI-PUGE-AT-0066]|nr:hypothetical protein BKA62DRAFT_775781 [Auriculariales sp. MPI-PUGE-AT-0066]
MPLTTAEAEAEIHRLQAMYAELNANHRESQLRLTTLSNQAQPRGRNRARTHSQSRRRTRSPSETPSVEQDDCDTSPPPRRNKRRLAAAEKLSEEDLANVKGLGRRIGVTTALWLRPNLFRAKEDPNFNIANRYLNENSKRLGQLSDIREELPEPWDQQIHRLAVQHALQDGISEARSRMRKRVIQDAILPIFGRRAAMLKQRGKVSEDKEFRLFSGYKPKGTANVVQPHFSVFQAPCLNIHSPLAHNGYESGDEYKFDGTEEFNLSLTWLRNPQLIRIHVAIFEGADALEQFNHGHAEVRVGTSSVGKMYEIDHATPHTIATCAVLSLYAYSGDVTLNELGRSGINYRKSYDRIAQYLQSGLDKKKKSVVLLFKHWDETIYPSKATMYGTKHGSRKDGDEEFELQMALLNDNEEVSSEDESEALDE